MALLHIPFDQIDEARLRALITAGAAESRTIDYKRTIYGNAHADYSEFLADISSFANTSGGDLVLGMEAANGIPIIMMPLTMPMDPEILRLEQVAPGGLQPRIVNIAFHTVPIQAGGNVLIIRIPRSYNPPHRIIRQGSNRFWIAATALATPNKITKKIRDFYSRWQKYTRMQTFVDWLVADFSIFGQDVQIWALFAAGMIVIWIAGVMWITKAE